MPTRTIVTMISIHRPFAVPGVDGLQPAGEYAIETEEELLEPLSFAAWHRLSTHIRLTSNRGDSLVPIEPADIRAIIGHNTTR